MEKLGYCVQGQGHSEVKKKKSVNVCPDNIFRTAGHFVTKLGMAMQHHEPEQHAEKSVCCFQCQGHSEG